MKLRELVVLPKPLHQARFLLSFLLSPSPMPCALSEFRCSVTSWCFQLSSPHRPSRRQGQRGRPWPLLPPPVTGWRAVLMQWTFLVPSCSQEKKLLLNKEDSVQHPLLLCSPKQQHPSGERGVSCSLDKGALAFKRGILNSSPKLQLISEPADVGLSN